MTRKKREAPTKDGRVRIVTRVPPEMANALRKQADKYGFSNVGPLAILYLKRGLDGDAIAYSPLGDETAAAISKMLGLGQQNGEGHGTNGEGSNSGIARALPRSGR